MTGRQRHAIAWPLRRRRRRDRDSRRAARAATPSRRSDRDTRSPSSGRAARWRFCATCRKCGGIRDHRSRIGNRSHEVDTSLSAEALAKAEAGSDSHAHAAQPSNDPRGGNQHARQPWLQRQSLHLPAERRDLAVLNRAKPLEQRHRRGDAIGVWRIEPLERCPAAIPTPGSTSSGRRQIDAMNLRLAMRPQPIARVPEPPHDARPEPAGAAGALIGAVERDAFGGERIDAAIGVVARDLLQAGVDHRRTRPAPSARFRRCSSRRSPRARRVVVRRQRRILIAGVERTVQRRPARRHCDRAIGSHAAIAAAISRAPGRKHRTLPRRCTAAAGASAVRDRFAGPVFDRHRMQRARDVDDRAAAEKRGDRRGVERRRHHQDAQIRSRQPRLLRQRQAEVGVDAALVKLIDDERRDVAQQRIVLQVGGQDAFGDDQQPRVAR